MLFRQWRMALKQFVALFLTAACALMPYLYRYTQQSNQQLRQRAMTEINGKLAYANQILTSFALGIRDSMVLMSSEQSLIVGTDSEDIRTLLQNFVEKNSAGIRTLYYLPRNGEVICSKQVYFDLFGNKNIEMLYDKTLQGFMWHGIIKSDISGRNLMCSITVLDDMRNIRGNLVGECDYASVVNELSRRLITEEYEFYLLDCTGNVIGFRADSDWIPLEKGVYPYVPSFELQKVLEQLEDGEKMVGDLLVVKSSQNALGWPIGLFCKGDYYSKYDLSTQSFFLSSAFALLMGLLLISAVLTIFIMRPLGKLVVKMRSIHSIEDLSEMPLSGKDEVGQLISSYNYMVRNIHRLMEEAHEKEAMELKMLRSQIGPHFLYNTLSCVGSLARQGKAGEASEAIRSLIKLLSFSFDKAGEEVVELWEELEGLNAYVGIQMMRHGPLFDFEVDCPAECKSSRIPKLTLQPLVENAIYHGLLPIERAERGRIIVRAVRMEGGCKIEIRDNGIGIQKERLWQLENEIGENALHDRFSGIGVSNVRRRLELHGAQLQLSSQAGRGTQVTIILPDLCT